MKINIADTIRCLRNKMEITQEEFANAIGITPQAVSKWERGEGYPDITFLPDIAEYFNVTLDTLCGVDKQREQAQISLFINKTSNASTYAEGIKIAREGLAKFPHSILLKNNLAESLMGCTASWVPPTEVLEEVTSLYEDIMAHCPNLNDISPSAYTLLCQAYTFLGKNEKAKQIALHVNGKYERQRIFCEILKGEELVLHIQNGIIQTLPDIHFMIIKLLKTDGYSVKEKIALCKKMIDIYAQFDESHNWPIGLVFSYQLYLKIAVFYMKLDDYKESLVALDKAADLTIRTDSLPCEGYPSSLLLDRINYQYLSGTWSEKANLREEIEAESAFDPLRETSEYKHIIAKFNAAT